MVQGDADAEVVLAAPEAPESSAEEAGDLEGGECTAAQVLASDEIPECGLEHAQEASALRPANANPVNSPEHVDDEEQDRVDADVDLPSPSSEEELHVLAPASPCRSLVPSPRPQNSEIGQDDVAWSSFTPLIEPHRRARSVSTTSRGSATHARAESTLSLASAASLPNAPSTRSEALGSALSVCTACTASSTVTPARRRSLLPLRIGAPPPSLARTTPADSMMSSR